MAPPPRPWRIERRALLAPEHEAWSSVACAWGPEDARAELTLPRDGFAPLTLVQIRAPHGDVAEQWLVREDGRAVRLALRDRWPRHPAGVRDRLAGEDWPRLWRRASRGSDLVALATAVGIEDRMLARLALDAVASCLPRRSGRAREIAAALRRAHDHLGKTEAQSIAYTMLSLSVRPCLGARQARVASLAHGAWHACEAAAAVGSDRASVEHGVRRAFARAGSVWGESDTVRDAATEAALADFVRARLPLAAVLVALADRTAEGTSA